MICRECGAIIKNNEEYCRKCGALVINFKQFENKALKNICIKNSLRGKFQSFINEISNSDAKYYKIEKINKKRLNTNDLGKLVSKYTKEKDIGGEEIKILKGLSKEITDAFQDLFKL